MYLKLIKFGSHKSLFISKRECDFWNPSRNTQKSHRVIGTEQTSEAERQTATFLYLQVKFSVGRVFIQRRQWHPTPALLPGESQGRGSLVGCRLWGRTESDTTEATQQQQQRQLSVINRKLVPLIMEYQYNGILCTIVHSIVL